MKVDYKIELTDVEDAQMKAARESHAIAMPEKKQLEKDDQSKKDAELKARRSQSSLDSGKLLLRKDNFNGARKQFEKAISEDPDSETAKEAAKLLESLPRT